MSEIKPNCMLCGEIDFKELSEEKYKDYIIHLKLDGERVIYVNGTLMNRRGIDITKKYPHININAPNIVADGELVVFDKGFHTNFDKVRTKFHYKEAVFVIFDVLSINGNKLMNKPLFERLEYLKNIDGENIRVITEIPVNNWEQVIQNNYEGLIIKNPSSTYTFSRSNEWLKVKNYKTETHKIIEIDRTENNSVVAIIENYGVPQKVYINSSSEKENLNTGDLIKVKFLERTENGALRQPVFAGV